MIIDVKLQKNVGVEDGSGIEIVSDTDYAELLQSRLEQQYPEAEINVESTYDLVERIYIDDVEYTERNQIENTIYHIRRELWQECQDSMD